MQSQPPDFVKTARKLNRIIRDRCDTIQQVIGRINIIKKGVKPKYRAAIEELIRHVRGGIQPSILEFNQHIEGIQQCKRMCDELKTAVDTYQKTLNQIQVGTLKQLSSDASVEALSERAALQREVGEFRQELGLPVTEDYNLLELPEDQEAALRRQTNKSNEELYSEIQKSLPKGGTRKRKRRTK